MKKAIKYFIITFLVSCGILFLGLLAYVLTLFWWAHKVTEPAMDYFEEMQAIGNAK